MKLLSVLLLLTIATCHFPDVKGKVPHLQNDQPALKPDEQGKPLENDAGTDDSSFVSPSNFKFGEKIIPKVVKGVKGKYWTEKRFIQALKKLGLFMNKDIKIFTASAKLIKRLLKSKDNVVDTYKPPVKPPCGGQQPADENDEEMAGENEEDKQEDVTPQDENDGETTQQNTHEEKRSEDASQQNANDAKIISKMNEKSGDNMEKRSEDASPQDATQQNANDGEKDETSDNNDQEKNEDASQQNAKDADDMVAQMDEKSEDNGMEKRNEDVNQQFINEMELGEKTQDDNSGKKMKELSEQYANDADLLEMTQDVDLKKWYAAIGQQSAEDTSEENNPEKRASKVVDICRETFSTTYVLAHAKFNLAYRIPNVHCPERHCSSKILPVPLGRCRKREKTLVLYVINDKMEFVPKTVVCGCACECFLYRRFA